MILNTIIEMLTSIIKTLQMHSGPISVLGSEEHKKSIGSNVRACVKLNIFLACTVDREPAGCREMNRMTEYFYIR